VDHENDETDHAQTEEPVEALTPQDEARTLHGDGQRRDQAERDQGATIAAAPGSLHARIIARPSRIATIRPLVSDRAHNLFLDLIAAGLGVGGVYVLADAILFEDAGGFATFRQIIVALIVLLVAVKFKKRRGSAFLAVSVGLLVGWMVELIRAIVLFEEGGFAAAKSTVISFLIVTLLIGYLGRWSMERRFRPHLDVD